MIISADKQYSPLLKLVDKDNNEIMSVIWWDTQKHEGEILDSFGIINADTFDTKVGPLYDDKGQRTFFVTSDSLSIGFSKIDEMLIGTICSDFTNNRKDSINAQLYLQSRLRLHKERKLTHRQMEEEIFKFIGDYESKIKEDVHTVAAR